MQEIFHWIGSHVARWVDVALFLIVFLLVGGWSWLHRDIPWAKRPLLQRMMLIPVGLALLFKVAHCGG